MMPAMPFFELASHFRNHQSAGGADSFHGQSAKQERNQATQEQSGKNERIRQIEIQGGDVWQVELLRALAGMQFLGVRAEQND